MAANDVLKFKVGGREVQVSSAEAVPLSLSYSLEDVEDFEKKKASMAFDVTIPATLDNSQTFNTPANPAVEDLTQDEFFKSHMPCVIEANGVELLKGKAFLKEATHTDRPESITINCYGQNGDWMVDLAEKSLHDYMGSVPHILEKGAVESSWEFNGQSETEDYVYAPARYAQPFSVSDKVVRITQLKPSLSIYWILWRAFNSLGYRISSQFMDTDYFRRLVLPWVWGSFYNFSDDDLKKFKFKALSLEGEGHNVVNDTWSAVVSPNVSTGGAVNANIPLNWSDTTTAGISGGYDNGRDNYGGTPSFEFNNGYHMRWTYLPAIAAEFGTIEVGLGGEVDVYFYGENNGGFNPNKFKLWLRWTVNGADDPARTTLLADRTIQNGTWDNDGQRIFFTQKFEVNSGDVIGCYFYMYAESPNSQSEAAWVIGRPDGGPFYELQYARRIPGSIIDFRDFEAFKKHKVLDLLRGVVDLSNLSIQTDSINRVVTIEPTYPYTLSANLNEAQDGYFKKQRLDWTAKQDLGKDNKRVLFQDAERELAFKFKADGNDGGVSVINKRHSVSTGEATYLFPQRFKTGKKALENRFFAPSVMVRMTSWQGYTGTAPYLLAIIPENVSNTSKAEDASLFQPKVAFYAGNIAGVGGWSMDPEEEVGAPAIGYDHLPYMYVVDYHPGGHDRPILTYNDQKIDGQFGMGLMRRFFLPRLAVMRHGTLYYPWMHLDMKDVTNWLHREAINIRGAIYYLVGIDNYHPLRPESVVCPMWKYHPVTQDDSNACYPSQQSVLNAEMQDSNDTKYAPALLLTTDLPQ